MLERIESFSVWEMPRVRAYREAGFGYTAALARGILGAVFGSGQGMRPTIACSSVLSPDMACPYL
jgi:hypothetical protein